MGADLNVKVSYISDLTRLNLRVQKQIKHEVVIALSAVTLS